MKIKQIFLFLLLGLLISASAIWAAASDITVKAEVDRAFITIGDEVNFRVTANHDAKIKIIAIDATGALDDFEVKKNTDFSFKEGKRIVEGKNFLITNFSLGEYVVKPVTVTYQKTGGKTETLTTNQLYVTVQTVDSSKDPNSDIKGIKGVLKLPISLKFWITIAISLALGLGFLIWKAWAEQAQKTAAMAEPLLSPHEEAYKALNELQYSELLKRGDVKTYFLKMSEIIRRYLERRLESHALERTTRELTLELRNYSLNKEDIQLIESVLSFCDLVKFAKYVPPVIEILDENKQAKLIVDHTREQEQAPSGTEIKDIAHSL
jgi:hypothetical protein